MGKAKRTTASRSLLAVPGASSAATQRAPSSAETIVRNLTSTDAGARASTCLSLAAIASDGGGPAEHAATAAAIQIITEPRVLAAIIQCVRDSDMAVRMHALGALRNTVLGGDNAGAAVLAAGGLTAATELLKSCIMPASEAGFGGSGSFATSPQRVHALMLRCVEEALLFSLSLCESCPAATTAFTTESCAPIFMLLAAPPSLPTALGRNPRLRTVAARVLHLVTERNEALSRAIREHAHARGLLQQLCSTRDVADAGHVSLHAAGTLINAYLLPVLQAPAAVLVSREDAAGAASCVVQCVAAALSWRPIPALSSVCTAFGSAISAYAAVEHGVAAAASQEVHATYVAAARVARAQYQVARRAWFHGLRTTVLALEMISDLLAGTDYVAVDDSGVDHDDDDAMAKQSEGASAGGSSGDVATGPAQELMRLLHTQLQGAGVYLSVQALLQQCLSAIELQHIAASSTPAAATADGASIPAVAVTAIAALPTKFRSSVALGLLTLTDRISGCVANACETVPLDAGTGESTTAAGWWKTCCEAITALKSLRPCASSLWIDAPNLVTAHFAPIPPAEAATIAPAIYGSIDSDAEASAAADGVRVGELMSDDGTTCEAAAAAAAALGEAVAVVSTVGGAGAGSAAAAASSAESVTTPSPRQSAQSGPLDPALSALAADPLGFAYGDEALVDLALNSAVAAEPVLGSFSATIAAAVDPNTVITAVNSLITTDISALQLQLRSSAVPSLLLALVALLRREKDAAHTPAAAAAYVASNAVPALSAAIIVPTVPHMRLIGTAATDGIGRPTVAAATSAAADGSGAAAAPSASCVALNSMPHIESADCEAREHAIEAMGLLAAPLPLRGVPDNTEPPYRIPAPAHAACGKTLAGIMLDPTSFLAVAAAAGDAIMDCYSYEAHNGALREHKLLEACTLGAKALDSRLSALSASGAPGARSDVAAKVSEVRRNLVRFIKYKQRVMG